VTGALRVILSCEVQSVLNRTVLLRYNLCLSEHTNYALLGKFKINIRNSKRCRAVKQVLRGRRRCLTQVYRRRPLEFSLLRTSTIFLEPPPNAPPVSSNGRIVLRLIVLRSDRWQYAIKLLTAACKFPGLVQSRQITSGHGACYMADRLQRFFFVFRSFQISDMKHWLLKCLVLPCSRTQHCLVLPCSRTQHCLVLPCSRTQHCSSAKLLRSLKMIRRSRQDKSLTCLHFVTS